MPPVNGAGRGFFAVDHRAWLEALRLGLDTAVAYLILARGTDASNRRTRWSVNAIEKRTSISRGRAERAIRRLAASGLLRFANEGPPPVFELLPADELPSPPHDDREPLASAEREVLDRVSGGGHAAITAADEAVLAKLELSGWGRRSIRGFEFRDTRPRLVWLPNTLVDGTDFLEMPLNRVREWRDPLTLRLLIDMYAAQNLPEHGGISTAYACRRYSARCVLVRDGYRVWVFGPLGGEVTWAGFTAPHRVTCSNEEEDDAALFWQRIDALLSAQLLDWVPCLYSIDEEGSRELIHTLGTTENWQLQFLGGKAAAYLARGTDGAEPSWGVSEGAYPVPAQFPDVELVDILRLRLAPDTRPTREWKEALSRRETELLASFQRLQHQGNINEIKDSIKEQAKVNSSLKEELRFALHEPMFQRAF